MTTAALTVTMNPELDLVIERVVDVSPELVWAAWTTPEHLKQWFAPKPWTTPECEIDLRPGGAFRSTMQSPEGDRFPNVGCYLEVTPNRRLIWTSALLPGYRPAEDNPMNFTAVIEIEPEGSGTRYRAIAIHKDAAARAQHEGMGFAEGWSLVLDQLVAYMKTV